MDLYLKINITKLYNYDKIILEIDAKVLIPKK